MRTFERRLLLIVLGGLAVRVAYAIVNRHYPVVGDAATFHAEAAHLAHGDGFRRVFEDVPTAEHPPVHIVLLALTDLVGLGSITAQKLVLAGVGALTVGLIGLIGRQLAGPRCGLVAAGIAAVYPMLWLPDGSLMSETTYGVFVAASLLLALDLARRPSPGRAAALGAVLAIAALTRGEALALIPLLLAPLAWRTRSWRVLAAGVAAFVLVLAPWTVRNLATFDRPVLISNNSQGIWAGANCHATYYTDQIGAWVFPCYGPRPAGDESDQNAVYRKRGLTYMRRHAGRLPVVVAARIGRLYDVYRPWGQGVFFAGTEGRRPRASKLGLLCYWALLPVALAGALVLRRRRDGGGLVVLLAPIAMVTLVGIATYGSTRFRFAAEPALVVLGAVALDALLRRRFQAART